MRRRKRGIILKHRSAFIHFFVLRKTLRDYLLPIIRGSNVKRRMTYLRGMLEAKLLQLFLLLLWIDRLYGREILLGRWILYILRVLNILYGWMRLSAVLIGGEEIRCRRHQWSSGGRVARRGYLLCLLWGLLWMFLILHLVWEEIDR